MGMDVDLKVGDRVWRHGAGTVIGTVTALHVGTANVVWDDDGEDENPDCLMADRLTLVNEADWTERVRYLEKRVEQLEKSERVLAQVNEQLRGR